MLNMRTAFNAYSISKARLLVSTFLACLSCVVSKTWATDTPFTSLPASQWPQISAVNDAPFQQEQFAGNGFLLEYKKKLYAVTAKHVFILIKSDKVTSVDIDDDVIKQWTMHPYGNKKRLITLGRLRNADPTEAIDFNIVEKDWLFFDVKQNDSNLKPLHLRTRPLVPGEKVFIAGCPYISAKGCTQNIYPGTFVTTSGQHILLDMGPYDGPPHRFTGLSGAPVVDAQGDVVGIVSTEMPNPNGKGTLYAPASVEYALSTLEHLR